MISSQFHPSTEGDDTLTMAEVAATAGPYGSGNNDCSVISIFGLVLSRDVASGDLGPPITDTGQKFRRLHGEVDITIS